MVLLLSASSFADTSKISMERGLDLRRSWPKGKDKRCCGYPLAPNRGFALRYYWLAEQSKHNQFEEGTDAIYSPAGVFLGIFSTRFVRTLILEGSGLLEDNRVINYAGKCRWGVGTCFDILDVNRYPFGRGAKRRPLVPFRSVAVDRSVIEIGEPIYIPELDGAKLPSGNIHDGCVRADDTGGGIKKRKIDFFVVRYSNFRYLLKQMWAGNWISPRVSEPKCDYLRFEDRPLHWPLDYAEQHRKKN